MTMQKSRQHDSRVDRVNAVLLRAIGRLAIASYELRVLRDYDSPETTPWIEFSDHLLESVTTVIEGAAHGTFAGNTVPILRDGIRIAVDCDHIDRLTEKVNRHIQVGRMLGLGEISMADQANLTP